MAVKYTMPPEKMWYTKGVSEPMKFRFSHRAGLTILNTMTLVAVVILVATFGWMVYQYFSGRPLSVKNANGSGRTVVSDQRDIKGFLFFLADEWRPVKKVYAAPSGRKLQQYAYGLTLGAFDEPAEEADTNLNAGRNENSPNPRPDDNLNLPVNENVNADRNTNAPPANTNSADENTNAPSDNENTNVATNANTPPEANVNMPDENNNANENVNVDTTNSNTNPPPGENLNGITNTTSPDINTNTANVNAEPTEVPTDVVSADEWYKHLPPGQAYLKVNWFCSAALTHLYAVTKKGAVSLGDFTGDCNNPNVSVKGVFVPQALGFMPPGQRLHFRIDSDHQQFGNASHESTDAGVCTIDYFTGAGHRDVFAAQFTCDDGYGIGVQDDIQFTVYIFPPSWKGPGNPLDLLTAADKQSDDDGDGLSYEIEIGLKTNPNNWDSDFDGLGDFEEVKKYRTDPTEKDTDKDGFSDQTEVNSGHNPLGPGQATGQQIRDWGAAPSQPGKPTISRASVTQGGGIATVSWEVAPDADGIVNWGADAAYGQYRSDFSFASKHNISFPVEAGKTYHYAIRSCTPAPHAACAATNDITFVGQ